MFIVRKIKSAFSSLLTNIRLKLEANKDKIYFDFTSGA
jgi:hypothetical protein